MKKRATNFAWCFVVLQLLFVLLCFSYQSINNYNELLEVCNEQSETLRKQEKDYEKRLKEYDSKCNDLQSEVSRLKEKLSEQKVPTYKYSDSDIYTLAQCVEAEAGYYDGHETSQKYITQVILNRVMSGKFPNTITDVIYEKNSGIPQFSTAYNGTMNRKVRTDTLYNVYYVLVHGTNLPKYVTYFYSAEVTENWVNTLPTYDTVEGTVFAYESKEDY